MSQAELQRLLIECAADRLALIQRHEAAARIVSHYDFNNAYQYVIAREETHLSWLQAALTELELAMPQPGRALPLPQKVKGRVETTAYRGILEDEARLLGEFVERWRPRVTAMTQARHRTMLEIVLGESLEHQRLFQQAASGFEDLLGRRTGGVARTGEVLSTRWVE